MAPPLSFLDLPKETRDVIYTACLTLETTPPPSSPPKENIKRLSSNRPDQHDSQTQTALLLQPNLLRVVPSAAALLSTNQQVNSEVRDTNRRLKARKAQQLTYRIDVMVENEHRMSPTWVSIPVVPDDDGALVLDSLEIDFEPSGPIVSTTGTSGGYLGI